MLEAQDQRKKRESRWMLSMMSGGLATAFPAALVFDVFSSPRTNWTLGAAALPFAAGMVLGLAVPKHAERLTGSAVSLGIALSATAFAFEAADGPRDERPLMLGISVSLASSALSILLFSFLSDAHPERAFQAYRAQKDEERPRAAMGVLAQHDRKVRKGAGRAILAGLLSLGAVGIVAAATHDARAFAIGAPNQAGLINRRSSATCTLSPSARELWIGRATHAGHVQILTETLPDAAAHAGKGRLAPNASDLYRLTQRRPLGLTPRSPCLFVCSHT